MHRNNKKPYISIVIPAFNEEDFIGECLNSLLLQQTSTEYEIIVVDNNSTDTTAAIASKKNKNIRVIQEKQPGVCAARQAGLEAARGKIVVSTDADCIYPRGWLERIVSVFIKQSDVSLYIGTYRFKNNQRLANFLLGAWESMCLRLKYGYGMQKYTSAANLAYRKERFTGYNPYLGAGGDELYVLKELQHTGRVVFDTFNPLETSARRLAKGLGTVLLRDFGYYYVYQYVMRKRKSKPMPTYRKEVYATTVSAIFAYTIVCTIIVTGGILLILGIQNVRFPHVAHPLLFCFGLIAINSGFWAYILLSTRSQLTGPCIYRVPTQRKCVALTFDDGPNQPYTLQIADILESYGGKGTFFQVGKCIQRDPETTATLHRRGHVIGGHSWNHSLKKPFSQPFYQQELDKTHTLLESITAQPVKYFRPPWILRTQAMMHSLRKKQLHMISGTFLSLNEFKQPSGKLMASRTLERIKSGDILICHDGYNSVGADRTQTVEAVRILCAELHKQGYEFVGIDELVC